MKGVSKTRFLSLFSCQRLDWLQVEVVVKMEVVEVLSVDQEVEHVVTLTTDLKPHLHPVKLGRLEKLCCLERPEEVPVTEENDICQSSSFLFFTCSIYCKKLERQICQKWDFHIQMYNVHAWSAFLNKLQLFSNKK